MARRKNKGMMWLWWILMAVAGIGFGELFTSGVFLNTTILGVLPEVAHTIVGWVFVVGALINAFMNLPK
jgi:hypothetical protein